MRRSTLFAVMLPAFGATLPLAPPNTVQSHGQANRQTRLELEPPTQKRADEAASGECVPSPRPHLANPGPKAS